MIATARAHVAAPGVLSHLQSTPPLTLRRVDADSDEICALCLVGSAAGPLPGDDLRLQLQVADHAQASLVATGATIAQGRGVGSASVALSASVGAGARLDADPGAVIVSAGARLHATVSIELAESATVRWRELVVCGRTAEASGAAILDWTVRRGGRALLRQHIDLADPVLRAWPGQLGGYRVLLSELNAGPHVRAITTVLAPTAVTQRLAEHATLTTVLATDVASAIRVLDGSTLAAARPPAPAGGR